MYITRKYIMDNRTDKGAWTQAQIEALGLTWPPRQGWINRVIDTEISPANQKLFESRMTKPEYKRWRKVNKRSIPKPVIIDSWDKRKTEALKRHAERVAEEELDLDLIEQQREWL